MLARHPVHDKVLATPLGYDGSVRDFWLGVPTTGRHATAERRLPPIGPADFQQPSGTELPQRGGVRGGRLPLRERFSG